MKPIEELLKNLGRAEVLEFGLVTNRLPSVNIGGKFEPVDDEAPTTAALLEMLVTMGGSRYVEHLSERPVQWTTRLDGVGVIAVAAIMRKDIVQARFTVARRDSSQGRSQNPGPLTPSTPPPSRKDEPAPPIAGAVPAAQQSRPPGDHRRTPQGTGGPQPNALASQSRPPPAGPDRGVVAVGNPVAMPSKPAIALSKPASATAPPVAVSRSSSAALKAAASQVPTQSPSAAAQVAKAPAGLAGGPAAAAAAGPALAGPLTGAVPPPDEDDDDDDEPTVQTLSPPVASPGGPGPKVARKPVEDAGLDPAEVERKAAEERKVAAERVAVERAASDKRAAIERAAAERAVAAERAGAERKQAERAKVERRITTPTSVDAVDVEITTSDSGTRPVSGGAARDAIESTFELTAAAQLAVVQAAQATTPSAIAQDRAPEPPRGDGQLESFLGMAIAARASDIHLVGGRPLLLRVATDLLPHARPVPAENVERIAREIVPARLRETLENDGSCGFAIDHPSHGRFRVNVSRQRSGYKLSMRVVPRDVPTLALLELPEAVSGAAKHAQGLVLVTGPTGHGKTTTVAAIVDILNRDTTRHVLIIEDPVEFVHPRKRAMISQREVGTHARSFATALAASMREDPDVIVVGDLHDAETARLAIAASERGHLVIATVNTPTAAKTVDWVIDMFPPAEQPHVRASLAGVLRLIVGQRLVPSADRTRLHAAVELLPSSIALYTLIRDARSTQIASLQQRGGAQGAVRLDESLAELVRTAKVTLEVAKLFAESPHELEAQATRNAPAAVARKA